MSTISCGTYEIKIDENWKQLADFIFELKPSKIFVLVDEYTEEQCLPIVKEHFPFEIEVLRHRSGEKNKNLEFCQDLWKSLVEKRADRKSLMINLGGGVIGDMGGFVAASYMRGIPFIHIPTSLLSMVDASVGSKLGVDFMDRKNMVGCFKDPKMVWVHTAFLKTLDKRQLKSGFAEVIKHALVASPSHWEQISTLNDLEQIEDWSGLVEWNIRIKKNIVEGDPFEEGGRKVLNYGHTLGHAIESSLLHTEHSMLHGEAIAAGMIMAGYLSHLKLDLDYNKHREISALIKRIYGIHPEGISNNLESIKDFVMSDKKNVNNQLKFVLLSDVGQAEYGQVINTNSIGGAIKHYLNMDRPV